MSNPYEPPRNSNLALDNGRSAAWTKGLLAILLTATLLNYANRFTLTQNALQVQQDFQISEGEYGVVNGWFSLGFAFGGLVFGIVADKISVRWLYPAVVVIWSAACFSSGLAWSVATLSICQFALGFFEAGHWPCALRTTQRTFRPSERTWGNSVLQSGASIGAVLTPLLVAGLYRWDPAQWRLAFFLVGAAGLPWAVWWLLTIRESDVRRPVFQTDDSGVPGGEERELQEVTLSQIFLSRRWWLLLWVVCWINLLWHYIRVWMPLTLEKDHGYSKDFVAYFTSLYYVATFFGSLACGGLTAWLSRRGWNVHRARLLTFLIFSLLSTMAIPAAFVPGGPWLFGALLVVAFGSLGLFPIYYSLNQEISARHQGKVGGSLAFATWSILYFVHPLVGSLVQANPGIRSYLFAAAGVGPLLAWLAIALFWVAGKPDR